MIVRIGTVSAGYGVITGVHSTPHTGIDYVVPYHYPIYAPYDGVISSIRDYGNTSLGKAIFIQKADGTQYCIGHLSEYAKVKVGEIIHHGQLLAYSGNSGNSTGPHLHYGEFLANGMPIDPGNIPFSAFEHHPVTDWIYTHLADFVQSAVSEMIQDLTVNVFTNAEFLTLLIMAFALWYMISSLRWGKWIFLGVILYLIAAL